jgi:hypothetical protein
MESEPELQVKYAIHGRTRRSTQESAGAISPIYYLLLLKQRSDQDSSCVREEQRNEITTPWTKDKSLEIGAKASKRLKIAKFIFIAEFLKQ